MAASIGYVTNSNLLGPVNWTAGSGSVAGANGYPAFTANGPDAEQNRYLGTDPWGNTAMVWQTVPTNTNDADGGWNTGTLAINSSKLYRFSVWVKRTSSTSGGQFYLGTQSSTGGVANYTSGSTDTNPYFTYLGTNQFTQNQWYLVTGHVFPTGYISNALHPESGFFITTGKTGQLHTDFSWPAAATTTQHRCYHYYCADATTRLEFYDPRIDLCDGTEPSISRLLAGPMVGTTMEGILYGDNTVQTTSAVDDGVLLSINTYTSAGTATWTKPSGCRKVYVRLAGGGGGAAGYCESGGAGGYSEGMFDVSGVSTVTVTVGSGGAAVTYYTTGGDGGTSSFGSFISATGGYGANRNYSHSGGAGGTGSGGFVNLQGGGGVGHINSVGSHSGGRGGASYFGGTTTFVRNHGHLSASYIPVANYGAVGSGGVGSLTDGATTGGNTGSAGNGGIVIVYNYS